MAALQKERAIALGFDEDIAKAIGIAEATKYAIFKNLSYKRRLIKEKETVQKEYKNKTLDEETFKVFKLQAINGWPIVGDKVYKSEDYDRYFLRFSEEVKAKIEEWARGIIRNCNKEILEKENKFFNECWKPHRDEISKI